MHIAPRDAAKKITADALFLALFSQESLPREAFFSFLPEETRRALARFKDKEFKGDEGEIKMLWRDTGSLKKIVLFGLGDKKTWNARKQHLVSRRMIRFALKEKISSFATPLSPVYGDAALDRALRFSKNAVMAAFDYNRYKTKPKEGWPSIRAIDLLTEKKDLPEATKGTREGVVIGEETNAARVLANTPGGDMTPRHLAEAARASGKKHGFRVRVLEEHDMKKLGMGGILGVSRGSAEDAKFIILEYKKGPANQKPLVLVGKGITFDTGGLNLKPDNYIYEMHMDMSGGAAVIHGVAAIARLRLPINVIGLVPAAENMPSGSSYRPGDVLKTMSGKTIEVLNTDAEGRIVLADALAYGTKLKPGLMVDFATLTGAAHVALGNYASALFTKDEKLAAELIHVGERSGDYVWPLPLWDEYLPEIKGVFGDLANTGKGDRWGGATHGAKFLEQFTDGTRWAHIDIAPKMTTLESEYLAKGASGVGVRFMVGLAKIYQKL